MMRNHGFDLRLILSTKKLNNKKKKKKKRNYGKLPFTVYVTLKRIEIDYVTTDKQKISTENGCRR